jgi:hypothetical protein
MEARVHRNDTSNNETTPDAATMVGSDHIGAQFSQADHIGSTPRNSFRGHPFAADLAEEVTTPSTMSSLKYSH